jgi:hypothetical protein
MTPVEWNRFMAARQKRLHDDDVQLLSLAWHTARLHRIRADDFPSLASLLEPPVEAVELSTEEVQRQQGFADVVAAKLAAREERRRQAAAGKQIVLTDAPEIPTSG